MAQKNYTLSGVQALREKAGLTQSELAQMAAVKVSALQKHERGVVHDAKLSLAVPIARVLGVPVEQLFSASV